jgi:cytochrome P450
LDGHLLNAGGHRCAQARDVADEFDGRKGAQQHFEHHSRFQPRQLRANAGMFACAKGDVRVRTSGNIELLGSLSEDVLVPIRRAVEEMLRFTSPVTHMAREATEDVEIRGQLIKAGDTVVMLYGAANRDEDIFGKTAEQFDITRSPNPHIAFGAGEHACIGAQLARLEARVMFEVLLSAFPSIELVGDVTRLRATMTPGVKKMPVRLGATI